MAQGQATRLSIGALPESQIDIPIQVNLRPFFAMAEKNVDTVFTSPSYPDGWVEADCATRYKYRFRRSPLSLSLRGTTLDLGFTGYYQITGSTRVCVKGTVLSPWSPACKCGFEEGERRVNVSFTSTFTLQPNLVLQNRILRSEPEAVDKCSVCFWGQDITQEVISGLKSELDASKKAMEASYGSINLCPYLQAAWDRLYAVYSLPYVGYLSLHPKTLRMQSIQGKNDLLNITISLSATPVVGFEKPTGSSTVVPDLSAASTPGGFNIHLEAALQYDSLSRVLNGYLAGKRFEVSEGLFKKHIIVQQTEVSGDSTGRMQIRLDFTGSFDGTVYFTGTPVYNEEKKTIEMQSFDYDLKTRNLLLKTAKWLFNNKIISELRSYTSFDLSNYYAQASTALNGWLNAEWTKGIRGSGSVQELKLTGVYAQPEHLLIRSLCAGKLQVNISEINLAGK